MLLLIYSASEVTTLWRYTNLFIIISIIIYSICQGQSKNLTCKAKAKTKTSRDKAETKTKAEFCGLRPRPNITANICVK